MTDLSDYKRKVSDPLEKHLRGRIRELEADLVAAERAGYERCKQDATTAIKALYGRIPHPGEEPELDEVLAVVAALDATQPGEGGA